jgi:GT2 family glycosyltransferase
MNRSLPPENLENLVVIVCYKAIDLTIACLESLSSQIDDVPGTKVAVCENGTGVDAARALEEAIRHNGWTEWVRLKAIYPNRGFSGGNNAILRDVMAWPEPPRFVVLLNADTIVRPGALARMHVAIAADPALGILGPRLVSVAGDKQPSCFRNPTPLSEFLRAARTGVLHRLFGRSNFELAPSCATSNFDWISFACAILRREVLVEVGLIDEGFFLYFDDPDYCRRARRAGWSIGYCDEAEVVHLEGQSNSAPADAKARRRRPQYFYVSRSRYFGKHFGRMGLWLANVCWAAGRSISILRELLGQKDHHVCAREWRDIWTNAREPIDNSEPGSAQPGPVPPSVQSSTALTTMTSNIGIVIIGRNEGERLRRCLESVGDHMNRVVYVDSESTDGSANLARSYGAFVVELDGSTPLSAARGRNAGFDMMTSVMPETEYVQFIDSDCELSLSWLDTAIETLRQRSNVAIVTGRLRERNRDASIYKRLCDMEWCAPIGEVLECGGVFTVRADAFRAIGGFDATLLAGEEPELCARLRDEGWKVVRIGQDMGQHDADMIRFSQWWRRCVRSGRAYAEVARRHGHGGLSHWSRHVRSNWLWGCALPLLTAALLWPSGGWSLVLLAAYPAMVLRIASHRLRDTDCSLKDGLLYGTFVMIGKPPMAIGQGRFLLARLSHRT